MTDLLALINITPPSIAFEIGPVPVFFYGLCYAIGLGAAYLLMTRKAAHRGLDPEIVGNGLVIVAAAALAGGRAYHVIDQWQLYKDNPLKIFLPPYSGLGVYGGLITGTIAAYLYLRWQRQPFWRWTDAIAPALFLMQAIGRWGNFFNQELYGPPTDAPWGIAIDCQHRVSEYPCSAYPATTGFQPLFFYESTLDVTGGLLALLVARRYPHHVRDGDVASFWAIWYGSVRFTLETFRYGYDWTLIGVPTAMLIGAALVLFGVATIVLRHQRPPNRMVALREPANQVATR